MPKYLIFFAVVMLVFYGIEEYKESGKNELQIDMSRETLYNLLESAKDDISKNYFDMTLKQIEKAIDYLKKVEQSLDPATNSVIDQAILDMQKVEQDIRNRVIYEKDLNMAFAKAMNALALAHLRVCEDELEAGHEEEALESLKATINHLQHSMKYSSGELLETEVQLVEELANLSSSGDITVSTIHKDVEKIRSIVLMKD